MPELPDVETYRRYLDAHALDQTIERVSVLSPRLLEDVSAHSLARGLKQHRLRSTHRHGKYLFVRLDDARWLALHFGMDGELAYYEHPREPPPHTGVLIGFANGFDLAYVSTRKLGRMTLIADPEEYVARKRLGPDALMLDRKAFLATARQARHAAKAWLMDQQVIAGVGNIYSDEILFHAGVQPQRPIRGCSDAELTRLFASMRKVLDAAVAAGADPSRMPRDFLLQARHAGGACPRCGALLRTLRAMGRTAYFCGHCQH
jgi:formamidopyrimidine-DNA glycosylase